MSVKAGSTVCTRVGSEALRSMAHVTERTDRDSGHTRPESAVDKAGSTVCTTVV